MLQHEKGLASALVSAALLLAACAATRDLAPGDAVPYPEGYRSWTHVKSMLIEEGHPLFESFGGIHHVYANDGALAGLRGGGSYDDGAIFAFDLLEARAGGRAVTEGERKVLGVMYRDADAFAATGGWGFAGFAGGRAAENVVTDAAAQCFECHTQRADAGHVFSTWRP